MREARKTLRQSKSQSNYLIKEILIDFLWYLLLSLSQQCLDSGSGLESTNSSFAVPIKGSQIRPPKLPFLLLISTFWSRRRESKHEVPSFLLVSSSTHHWFSSVGSVF